MNRWLGSKTAVSLPSPLRELLEANRQQQEMLAGIESVLSQAPGDARLVFSASKSLSSAWQTALSFCQKGEGSKSRRDSFLGGFLFWGVLTAERREAWLGGIMTEPQNMNECLNRIGSLEKSVGGLKTGVSKLETVIEERFKNFEKRARRQWLATQRIQARLRQAALPELFFLRYELTKD